MSNASPSRTIAGFDRPGLKSFRKNGAKRDSPNPSAIAARAGSRLGLQ
jgi:hypothetical protein